MRFTVVTSGGEGDTRPVAALCRGLMDAGHDVCLFTEASTSSFARSLGVPVQMLAGDMRSVMPADDPMKELRLADVVSAGKNALAVANDNAAARIRSVAQDAQTADAVLFSTFALYVGQIAAQEVSKPALGLWFQPITPTREFLCPMLSPAKLPGWMNLLSYRLLQNYLWRRLGRPAVAAQREVFGVRPKVRPRFDFPVLYGVSPRLVRQPRDWPQWHRFCGQWLRSPRGWQPSAELVAFLSAGSAPLYVGFGSSSSFVRRKMLTCLIDAVGGRRAVFSPGWSRIDSSMLPVNFYVLEDAPHDWLFPQMSAVVHHGGAGTTHSAARAGVPQVVLPLGGDQFFWAHAVASAGVAPRYVKGARLNARALAAMIEFTQHPELRERASLLGVKLSQEDGIGVAVRQIEEYVSAKNFGSAGFRKSR